MQNMATSWHYWPSRGNPPPLPPQPPHPTHQKKKKKKKRHPQCGALIVLLTWTVRLNKQWSCWWFKTPWHPCNVPEMVMIIRLLATHMIHRHTRYRVYQFYVVLKIMTGDWNDDQPVNGIRVLSPNRLYLLCLYAHKMLYDWLEPESNFYMMTSSNGNIFRVTGPLCREFTGPGPYRRCSNYTWVISKCIAYRGASYISDLTVIGSDGKFMNN